MNKQEFEKLAAKRREEWDKEDVKLGAELLAAIHEMNALEVGRILRRLAP